MNNTAVDAQQTQKSSDKTIFELLHAAHALEEKVEESLSRAGLSMAKYAMLTQLVAADGPVSLSELAALLSCVKSNITQLVDRLEGEGLVERVDDPSDRRSVRAAITEAGKARQAAGAAEVDRLHAEFAAAVGLEDRQALERLLTALG